MKWFNKLMPVGRRSLLFGVHQFIWHPWTVYLAWKDLYGKASFKQLICIFIHDWGYWNCSNMDGPQGELHPLVGAKIARKLFGEKYHDFVLLHSRHFAKKVNQDPSELCWADKLSILYDPKWFYLLRAKASGEIKEYRKLAIGHFPIERSDSDWYDWLRPRFIKLANEKRRCNCLSND